MSALRSVAVVVAVAIVAAPAPAHATDRWSKDQSDTSAARAVASKVTIKGRGFGHGRGLSQYGARNAARQGLGVAQILDHYYPGTTSQSASGALKVWISRDRGKHLVVQAQPKLKLKAKGIKRTLPNNRANRWRITGKSPDVSLVSFRRGGRWKKWKTVRGTAEFRASSPITLIAGGRTAYRGVLRSVPANAGSKRLTVNKLSMERYLRGVVALEMPALWEPAAVQAQAVAARTYAASERAAHSGGSYHICDTTQCQVYGGSSAEHPGTDAAIAATAKSIRSFAGEPAFTQFSASNGGWSAAGTQPYLVAQKDPYDTWGGNPYSSWTVTVPAAQLEKQWSSIGSLTDVQVVSRDGNGAFGGRAEKVRVVGVLGQVTMTGDEFRSALALRSTLIDPSVS